jgi:hypothetical protein
MEMGHLLDVLATLYDLDNDLLMFYENDGIGQSFNQQILFEGFARKGYH